MEETKLPSTKKRKLEVAADDDDTSVCKTVAPLPKIFVATEGDNLSKRAIELNIKLPERVLPGNIALNKFNGASRSTKVAYDAKLQHFWHFLTRLGKEDDKFMLLRAVPEECPGISVESVMMFIKWNLEYLKRECDEKSEPYLMFEQKYVCDINGNKIELRGGWGYQGSDKSIQAFESAITKIYKLCQQDDKYQYPKSNIVAGDKSTWPKGNPLKCPVYINFIAKVRRKLKSQFISQARDALTPDEQYRTYEELLMKGRDDLSFVMLSVILRMACHTSFRIDEICNLTYGSFLTEVTRDEGKQKGEIKCIGIKVEGKRENAASDNMNNSSETEGHNQQMYRNR